MSEQYVVVGGNAAGMSTAARLRRLDEEAEIIVLEQGDHVSYASCGLPYHLSETVPESDLAVIGADQLAASFALDVRTNETATDVDPEAQTVTVSPADGDIYTLAYDELVLATGAEPIVPPMFDLDELEHCYTMRTVPDAIGVREEVEAADRALVIGGGYIGIEVAENLAEAGLDVVVAELLDHVMPNTLGADMAAIVEQHLDDHGIDLRTETGVGSLSEDDSGTVIAEIGDEDHTFDLAVIATGVAPRTELAEAAGLELDESGAIAVDSAMRTSDPTIHAVGDAVAVPTVLGEGRDWVPLGGPANREGRVAANDIVGHEDALDPVLDTAIAKVFDLDVGTVGMTEEALSEAGRSYEAIYTSEASHAEYYPGAADIHFKLLFDATDGTLLGAQAVGTDGVDKRIDVLATAIAHGDTVYDIRDLDLAYAPPYSDAKDPVNILGMIGTNVLEGVADVISLEEFVEKLPNTLVIDTRPPELRETQGYIEGTTNVPLANLREWISETDLSDEEEVLTYCAIGKGSYVASRILKQHGIASRSLTGGYVRYETADELSAAEAVEDPVRQ